jgi:hypothetical protein
MTSPQQHDVLKQLREGILRLTNSDAWTRYLDVQRRFHQYSWGNCLLIAMQRPDATHVAGYHAWRKLNRQVNIGQRGIRILAPVTYKQSLIGKPDEHPNDSPEVRVLRSFRSVAVFDISQTSGEPLPEIAHRLLGPEPVHAFRRLQTVASCLGYRIDFTDLPDGRNGECDFANSVIRINKGIDAAQVAKTTAHELGHAFLHFPSELPAGMPAWVKELEAESVAYVVCQELGLDTSAYSLGYIAHWSGDGEKAAFGIETSAARIRKASHNILSSLENGMPDIERAPSERSAWIAETLHDEILAPMQVGSGGRHWPQPRHRSTLALSGLPSTRWNGRNTTRWERSTERAIAIALLGDQDDT